MLKKLPTDFSLWYHFDLNLDPSFSCTFPETPRVYSPTFFSNPNELFYSDFSVVIQYIDAIHKAISKTISKRGPSLGQNDTKVKSRLAIFSTYFRSLNINIIILFR